MITSVYTKSVCLHAATTNDVDDLLRACCERINEGLGRIGMGSIQIEFINEQHPQDNPDKTIGSFRVSMGPEQ